MSEKKISNNSVDWKIDSWRKFPIKQQPNYLDKLLLKQTENQLKLFPPLVSYDEIEKLKKELAMVSRGEAFLLQGGDCAESFAEFSHDNLKSFFRTIMQMTIALIYGLKKPVVKIGRIAGQYAKPRSQDSETIDNKTLPSYRGDIVNKIDFDENSRNADPQRLIESYFYSASSLNYLRSLALGGYGNLIKVNQWNNEFAHSLKSKQDTEVIIDKINDILGFVNSCGLDIKTLPEFTTTNFFTSHEALLLNYEECFTKFSNDYQKFYNLSAHFLWIGDRTRNLDEAHLEFTRGIANPIGFKVGPSMTSEELIKIIEILNPQNEEGKITLISRMGADKIEKLLPPLINATMKAKKSVIWSCDPMHGNTIKASNNYKTRHFDSILKEISLFFKIHQELGSYAGGIHFEMTGQDVTECLGGNQQISEINLQDRYNTHCDPRLNASQSVELAFLIAKDLANKYS